jgi:regulator of RNase E activity RraB
VPNKQDDATEAALQRIARDGSDLSRPLKMDFFVAVPDQASGQVMAARASELGFDTSVERDVATEEWTCYCTKVLVPTHAAVVAIESQLDSLAREIGGYIDGFGTFGNGSETTDGVS